MPPWWSFRNFAYDVTNSKCSISSAHKHLPVRRFVQAPRAPPVLRMKYSVCIYNPSPLLFMHCILLRKHPLLPALALWLTSQPEREMWKRDWKGAHTAPRPPPAQAAKAAVIKIFFEPLQNKSERGAGITAKPRLGGLRREPRVRLAAKMEPDHKRAFTSRKATLALQWEAHWLFHTWPLCGANNLTHLSH